MALGHRLLGAPGQEGRALDSSSRRRRRSAGVVVGICCFAMVGHTAALSQDRGTTPIPAAIRLGNPPPGGAVPSLPALPDTAQPVPSAGAGSAANVHGPPLIAGQEVQPIDLAGALRLAGARDLDIATARQQVLQALGELDQALAGVSWSGMLASTHAESSSSKITESR